MALMARRPLVCVGSGDTNGDIQVFAVRETDAALEPLSVVATGAGVSYLSLHPTGDVAYVTYSHADRLSALAIDRATGHLRRLNDVSTGSTMGPAGSGACYATVDATGRFLLIASYRGHTVSVWTIEEDGRIGGTASRGWPPSATSARSAGHRAPSRWILAACSCSPRIRSPTPLQCSQPTYAPARCGRCTRFP
jgi:6-phosphogluconolactonase